MSFIYEINSNKNDSNTKVKDRKLHNREKVRNDVFRWELN